MQRGYFLTKYGWKYWISPNEKINPRRLINWPIQSHGSEILRRAIIDLDEAGFEIYDYSRRSFNSYETKRQRKEY